jgi:DNA polymerase III sliding clamp (beta) subunit (PCNA family)
MRTLKEAVKIAGRFTHRDKKNKNTRQEGVSICNNHGALTVVATDGHRLVIIDCGPMPRDMEAATIDNEGLSKLTAKGAEITFEKGIVYANGEKLPRICGDFPNWRSVVPPNHRTYSLPREQAIHACKRVLEIVRTHNKEKKISHALKTAKFKIALAPINERLKYLKAERKSCLKDKKHGDMKVLNKLIDEKTVEKRDLTLSNISTLSADIRQPVLELSWEDDSLTAKAAGIDQVLPVLTIEAPCTRFEGDECRIGINAKYLKEALSSMTEDVVTLSIEAPMNPVKIYDGSVTSVIVPIRL